MHFLAEQIGGRLRILADKTVMWPLLLIASMLLCASPTNSFSTCCVTVFTRRHQSIRDPGDDSVVVDIDRNGERAARTVVGDPCKRRWSKALAPANEPSRLPTMRSGCDGLMRSRERRHRRSPAAR
jgi:hypothetical protein